MAVKLSEILIKQGLLRPDQVAKILEEEKHTGRSFVQIVTGQALLKESQILKALETHYHVPSIDLNNFVIKSEVLSLIPRETCIKHHVIPVQKAGQVLVVAFADPGNIIIRDDLRFVTRLKIQVVVASEFSISSAIDRYYGSQVQDLSEDDFDEVSTVSDKAQDAEVIDAEAAGVDSPIIKFVNTVLTEAIRKRASDVHFEPYEKRFRVRFRMDGNLVETTSQPISSGPAISSRIKIMAKLDIAEKRRPQDGRIKIKLKSGKDMDFRVSVLPTIWGEKVVMRLLDKSNLQLDMTKLGMEPDDLELLNQAIHAPQGMVLITGPTGSGKTTTIYSALAELNKPDVNIATAEDPVEFNFDGINQVQMNSDIDLTFAAALRSFLRQDPDIIMVGEIRDLETAEIAAKAASTGHLVVSTLHTNDASQTVARLTEMGIAPYVVTSTISLIVAQRLVGRVCTSCKTPMEVSSKVLIDLGVSPEEVSEYKLMKGKGCNLCNNTGIKGRIAIFETMRMTDKIKDLILAGAGANDIRNMARQEGMRTLRRSALLKLKRGETTIEDVVNTSVKDML